MRGADEAVGVGGFEERPVGGFDVGEDRAAAGEDHEIGGRRRRDGRQDDLAAVADVDRQAAPDAGRPSHRRPARRAAPGRPRRPSAAAPPRLPWVSQPDLRAPAVRSALSALAVAGPVRPSRGNRTTLSSLDSTCSPLVCRCRLTPQELRTRSRWKQGVWRGARTAAGACRGGRRAGGRRAARRGRRGPAAAGARTVGERLAAPDDQTTIVARVRANR